MNVYSICGGHAGRLMGWNDTDKTGISDGRSAIRSERSCSYRFMVWKLRRND